MAEEWQEFVGAKENKPERRKRKKEEVAR